MTNAMAEIKEGPATEIIKIEHNVVKNSSSPEANQLSKKLDMSHKVTNI